MAPAAATKKMLYSLNECQSVSANKIEPDLTDSVNQID